MVLVNLATIAVPIKMSPPLNVLKPGTKLPPTQIFDYTRVSNVSKRVANFSKDIRLRILENN